MKINFSLKKKEKISKKIFLYLTLSSILSRIYFYWKSRSRSEHALSLSLEKEREKKMSRIYKETVQHTRYSPLGQPKKRKAEKTS